MMRRAVLTVALVLGLGVSAAPAQAYTAAVPPTRIAALGDSITRAFDVNGSYFLKDAPRKSWSTGDDGSVQSQYLRLKQKYYSQTTATLAFENDAVTGAKMATLDDQMRVALANGADYITVLMGANDVCTKTVADMTPTATFEQQFNDAMKLTQTVNRPVTVYVLSIPNVYHLWEIFSKNSTAKFTWSLYGVCQDLLSSRATAADRAAVANQVDADNEVLARLCTTTYSAICAWDSKATFSVSFVTTDVSTVDYFHPSVAGQNKLASAAWGKSPYAP